MADNNLALSRASDPFGRTTVSAVKVSDFLYGRLQSPDLDRAEAFLAVFGMARAARTNTALYMRGTDPVHYVHVTELGEPRFLGLGFAVTDPDDLKRIARLSGASGIESIDEPGGDDKARQGVVSIPYQPPAPPAGKPIATRCVNCHPR